MKRIFFLVTGLIAGILLRPLYGAQWQERKGQHFVIYYKKAPTDFVKTVEKAAEEYYTEIAQNLGFTRYKGWTWDDRAKIYIYDDGDDYVRAGRQARWSHGVASPQDKVIRTFPAAHGFFDSTLPHELTHIVFREFVGFKAKVPLWFEEGVAMYQEKAKRFGSELIVKSAIKEKTFIPLKDLTQTRLSYNTNQDDIDLFYAESANIVYYMINELGSQKFVNLCRALKEGKPFESAIHSVYYRFKNLEDLNETWTSYLSK